MLVNKKLLKRFRNTKTEEELNSLIKEFIDQIGLKVDIIGEVPKDKPVLVICNHPGGTLDSFLVNFIINRKDSRFVGISKFSVLGPVIKNNLLPVFNHENWGEKLLNFILGSTMNIETGGKFSPEERRSRNRESIAQAAKSVSNGGIVSIFPTGGTGKKIEGAKWKAGVGYLASQINNPDTLVIFANIIGTNKRDYLAFASEKIRKIVFRIDNVKVSFSQPELLSEVIDKKDADGKEVVAIFEKKYEQLFN